MKRRPRRKSREQDIDEEEDSPSSSLRVIDDDEDDDNEEEDEDDAQEITFTQQAPELSQPLQPVRQSERARLETLSTISKDKAVTALSRLLLFKALAGEPIERNKCSKEALGDFKEVRISSAVFDEAAKRLKDVFGFELNRVPKFMEARLPGKFKDRLYATNRVEDDESGSHSKAIHRVHPDAAIERGLLMVILSFSYCKGQPKKGGLRWIKADDLYRLLHGVDENMPPEPPETKTRRSSMTGRRNSQTPDVDVLLEKFVRKDYLLRDKLEEDGGAVVYAMGPRAAMEIGRRQIVYFCAELLDEQPDPTMLAEIEASEQEFEEEEEDVEMEVN